MPFFSDMKILYHMLLKPVRGGSHAERMESFYGGQAEAYDDFRRRLLRGREELWAALPRPAGGTWVDMGGGTGANLENFGDTIHQLKQVWLVDLAPSLLRVAADRFQKRGWTNAQTVEADATTWTPPEGPGTVDVVTFSYSLTMIPDWFAAIANARRILKPGGVIGVVDFYVGRKYPPEGAKKQGWLARTMWPPWFAFDNVFPSPDHLPFLLNQFERLELHEHRNRMPYVPFFRTPWYWFVGRKPVDSSGG